MADVIDLCGSSDEETDADQLRQWMAILKRPRDPRDSVLYDDFGGIKAEILRVLGFHDKYLSYKSSPSTRYKTADRMKGEGSNWVSSAQVHKEVKGKEEARILQWHFCLFYNQSRFRPSSDPYYRQADIEMEQERLANENAVHNTRAFEPNDMHGRGVFIFKPTKVFVVYEPREYHNHRDQWFDETTNSFAQNYPSLTKFVVYGSQASTEDCEKRVLRFGACCWNKFKMKPKVRVCHCGLEITHVAKLYVRNAK